MSLDRTEDVELVDAPTTLELSKLWLTQYEGLTDLTMKLKRNIVKAVKHIPIGIDSGSVMGLIDEALEGTPRQFYPRYNFSNANGYCRWDDTPDEELPRDLRLYIRFSALRKATVSFNRYSNPDWNHEKAEKRLSEYDTLRVEVTGNKHISMPDLQLPHKAPTMPFISKASQLLQDWMSEQYDFETKLFRVMPRNVAQFRVASPMKRKILISIDEDEAEKKTDKPFWVFVGVEDMYDVTDLYRELTDLEIFYDAGSAYASMLHHINHLEHLHHKEGEEKEGNFF